MKTIPLVLMVIAIFTLQKVVCQDLVVFKNGDTIKSRVLEISTEEIKYKKFDNPDGPTFSVLKSAVQIIVYQNGTRDVFGTVSLPKEVNKSEGQGTVIFYRGKKMSGAAAEFIIGCAIPDTVIVNLKNGTYHEFLTSDIREWEFIGAIYKISDSLKINIESGKTYYVRCWLKEGFPAVTARFDLVDKENALKAIADLKKIYKKD